MNCRSACAVVLVALLTLQILPFSCRDDSNRASSEPGAFTCRFEPLQVCDHGDSFLGALAKFPVLVTGAPVLIPSTEVLCLVPDREFFAPDGFHPVIDHPPQLSA